MTPRARSLLILILCLGLGAGQAFAIGQDSDSAPKQNPDYVRAKNLIEANDYAGAMPLLRKVVAAEPRRANAHNYLGFSLRRTGDKQAAPSNYLQALKLEPEHRGGNEYLGELYLEMDRLDKVEERLEVLDKACFFGCDAYRELEAAIAAHRAKSGS